MATERAEVLRPAPAGGDTVAAAAVALTVLVATVNARFGDEWGQGIHLIYTAAAAFAVIGMAAASPRTEGRPASWQSVLFVTAFVLLFGTLTNLADVLGADNPPFGASGTVVWVGLILIGLTAWFATGWNSGISTLLGSITFVIVVIAFIDWVFSPEDVDTFRWILLLTALALGAGGAMRRPSEPEHAVGYVNAAGVAILALAGTFLAEALFVLFGDIDGIGASFQVGWGWELVVLAAAAALIAYSVVARQAGPGYLGALNLAAFVALAAGPGEDGPSLIGWPLVLILVTVALFVLARGGGGSGARVRARPSPDPSESTTRVAPER
jgi:hypothetical protein